MGDHRVVIKLDFHAHGKDYHTEMNVNYFDNGDGIDQRIVDWFADCWGDALSRYNDQIAEQFAREHAAEIETDERRELERLQAKYQTR